MSNLYKIREEEIDEFVSDHNTKKVILYYKQDCVFCKKQIIDLNDLAGIYKEGIEYAICDINNKIKYFINKGIVSLPTIQIYENGNMIKQFDSYYPYDSLKEEIIK